jgi:hypothetical protein
MRLFAIDLLSEEFPDEIHGEIYAGKSPDHAHHV